MRTLALATLLIAACSSSAAPPAAPIDALEYSDRFDVGRDRGGDDISHMAAMAYSPDGSRLYSGASTGEVFEFDVDGREVRRSWPSDAGAVTAMQRSPDGRNLAVARADGRIDVIRLGDGSTRHVSVDAGPAAFSADARWAAAAHEGTIRVIRLSDLRTMRRLTIDGETVTNLAVHGDHVLAATAQGRVRLWRGDETVRDHTYGLPMYSCAISPQGDRYAAGGQDLILRVWDTASGDAVHELSGHQFWITAISFSPDGNTIVSGDESCDMSVFDLTRGAQIQSFKHHNECWVTQVAWNGDEELVIGCRPNGYYADANAASAISGAFFAAPSDADAAGGISGALMDLTSSDSTAADSARSMEIWSAEHRLENGGYPINVWRIRR